jgi:hypothetical protein
MCGSNLPVSGKAVLPPSIVRKESLVVVLIALLALSSTSCRTAQRLTHIAPTLAPAYTDRSILTDTPCAAPCWYGLYLGEADLVEARRLIQGLPFVETANVTELPGYYVYQDGPAQHSVEGVSIRVPCQLPKEATCASLLFAEDLLVQVVLLPNYSLSLGQLVEHLGAPDYIQLSPTSEPGPLCDVALIWKSLGVRAAFLNRSSVRPQIRCDAVSEPLQVEASLPVHQVMYMLPTDVALASVPENGRDFAWSGFVPQR